MQLKPMGRYHLTLVRMVLIKTTTATTIAKRQKVLARI
jgi:hypothetical protein